MKETKTCLGRAMGQGQIRAHIPSRLNCTRTAFSFDRVKLPTAPRLRPTRSLMQGVFIKGPSAPPRPNGLLFLGSPAYSIARYHIHTCCKLKYGPDASWPRMPESIRQPVERNHPLPMQPLAAANNPPDPGCLLTIHSRVSCCSLFSKQLVTEIISGYGLLRPALAKYTQPCNDRLKALTAACPSTP